MKAKFVSADECCTYYNIELSFIKSLQEYGLMEITTINDKGFIHKNHLHELEKFIRLHYEMDINMEGIEAIKHLLFRIENMQQEINQLKNKLHLYAICNSEFMQQ